MRLKTSRGDSRPAGTWGSGEQRELQCPEARNLFSVYLDGAVTGWQMRAVQKHLAACAECTEEYRLLRGTQQMLASVGKPKLPADLGLKLRLAISHEAARTREPWFEGWLVRVENEMQAFMVPVTAGF